MYRLHVLTPEETFFDDDVKAIIAPGEFGYLGVMSHHAPLITSLKDGIFIITDKNGKKTFYDVSSGFMEVNDNNVSIIVEAIMSRPPIDIGITGGI